MPKNNKIFAFTLAEVLITLTIIGVISAITIPSLLQNTNNKELREKWRKAYSSINNATNLLIIENGGIMEDSFSSNDAAGWQEIIDMYSTKLNIAKTCNSSNISGNCWYTNSGYRRYYDNSYSEDWSNAISHGFVLTDGTAIVIHRNTNRTSHSCTGISNGTLEDNICIYFLVDVNGTKAPNQMGKDIYILYVHKDRVQPYQTTTDLSGYRCNKITGRGHGCSARWLISDEDEADDYAGVDD